MIETTELYRLREGAPYVWGDLIKIHDIGRYTIVEYKPRTIGTMKPREVAYGCYLDGENLSTSSHTLEGALLLCMAHGKIGNPNDARYMGLAAAKLLDLSESE